MPTGARTFAAMNEDTDAMLAWATRLNQFGRVRRPCFFVVDFERRRPRLWGLTDPALPWFSFPASSKEPAAPGDLVRPHLYAQHLSQFDFRQAFDVVQSGLRRGDSFLTNLTFPVPIQLNCGLRDVYFQSQAKYRVLLRNEFVCFSPETFITISPEGYVESRPMKGTALDTKGDRESLLTSGKEVAEHATIVDLIRNDLSMVAERVRVSDYRYFHKISTSRRGLVQTSSNIGGRLPDDWRDGLGDTMARLLPAGSVSGAPKAATVALIERAEGRPRGYYCGIAGYFDGNSLDTCVLIRFIERQADGSYFFRSGGGITARSRWQDELAELRAKVRIPLRDPR